MRTLPRLMPLALLLVASSGRADEGFWTFEKFPSATVQERHGFAPTAPWLEHLQRSTVLVGGCSGSFVSAEGLVVTSDDCLRSCLDNAVRQRRSESRLSEACRDHALREAIPLFDLLYCAPRERDQQRDHSEHGYLASSRAEEIACPQLEVKQLLEVQDVTSRLLQGREGETDTLLASLRNAQTALLQSCREDGKFHCEVENLYFNTRFRLHKYRRFEDARLVFLPERDVSAFGGQDAKFSFPRHAFPVGFVRVYEGAAPARTPTHLGWSEAGANEGELVFLSGFPTFSRRRMPTPWLMYIRRIVQDGLQWTAELRGLYTGYAHGARSRDPKVALALADVDSFHKHALGGYRALDGEALVDAYEDERRLRQWLETNPPLKARYEEATRRWDELMKQYSERRRQYFSIGSQGISDLLGKAIRIVRALRMKDAPPDNRYPGYTDAFISREEELTLRPLTVQKELEIEGLALLLRKQEEELGSKHPIVRRTLDGRSADARARQAVEHTALWDVRFRRALWTGGREAVERSEDPMIRLARILEAEDTRLMLEVDAQYNVVATYTSQVFGEVRYAAFGDSEAPEASLSSRVRFGQVKGYQDRGVTVPAFNALSGLFGLDRGEPPFRLPERWTQAKGRLDLAAPLTFSASTDVLLEEDGRDDLGGPLVNKAGQVVGVTIGGSEATIGADYRYSEDLSRTVGLHSGAILQVLERVYDARGLAEELRSSTHRATE